MLLVTTPLFDLAVRRLDEAEVVHASEAGETTDQTDVRALGSLDWTHIRP